MRARRGGARRDEAVEGDDELNLVPYLDVVTTLVLFLVFSFQVVVELRVAELMPRGYSEAPSATRLTLSITSEGYRIVSDDPANGAVDIPRRGGLWDDARLTVELEAARRATGAGSALVVTASDDIEYAVVVGAMDAAREFEGRPLFPDVLLARPDAG